jgi:hypothetical protein
VNEDYADKIPIADDDISKFDDDRERTPLATVARRAGARDVNPPRQERRKTAKNSA